jgi:ABC-2 type transport system permease protein
VPGSVEQVFKLSRYQFREYVFSRRFVVLVGLVLVIDAILIAVIAHYRASLVTTSLSFYSSFWGMAVNYVIILSAVFFGGDAIAGEFQNKTGYFLMGLPVRRATVYAGKYLAAFAASLAVTTLYLLPLLGDGAYYFGASAIPWQLGASYVLAVVYLAAVLGTTFLFSSLFKVSAYGFVLTAILFLFGFSLIQDLVQGLIGTEPWMVISYANTTIGSVFGSHVNSGLTGTITTARVPIGRDRFVTSTTYVAGVLEGVVIMLGYFVLTALAGLALFEREEFA